jgi:hypothetical protein
MSERQVLERKKGFMQWAKNGEEGTLAHKSASQPKGIGCYKYWIGIVRRMIG